MLSKERTPKRHVLEEDWTTYSKCINHFRHDSSHDGGGGGMWLYDMLITWRFFASTMNKIFIQTPKPYMENGYMHNVNMVIILH